MRRKHPTPNNPIIFSALLTVSCNKKISDNPTPNPTSTF